MALGELPVACKGKRAFQVLLFGRLSFREWGGATYEHADHHLRQFGA